MERQQNSKSPLKSALVKGAPAVGCATGGCLLPIILLLIAALLGDTGGPLFWPMLAGVLSAVGFIIGLYIRDHH